MTKPSLDSQAVRDQLRELHAMLALYAQNLLDGIDHALTPDNSGNAGRTSGGGVSNPTEAVGWPYGKTKGQPSRKAAIRAQVESAAAFLQAPKGSKDPDLLSLASAALEASRKVFYRGKPGGFKDDEEGDPGEWITWAEYKADAIRQAKDRWESFGRVAK